jgi:hypothetical protein
MAKAPAPNLIDFETAVKRGKALMDQAAKSAWELATIASNLHPQYGKKTVQRWAEAIELPYSTARQYMATGAAWKQIDGRPSFWIATELNEHPQRYKLIERKPEMTKREAQAAMAAWHKKKNDKEEDENEDTDEEEDNDDQQPVLSVDECAVRATELFQNIYNGGNINQFMAAILESDPTELDQGLLKQLRRNIVGAIDRLQSALQHVDQHYSKPGIVQLEQRRK